MDIASSLIDSPDGCWSCNLQWGIWREEIDRTYRHLDELQWTPADFAVLRCTLVKSAQLNL
jgi:hypothetical protein